jgi:hypothetical protein
MKIRMSDLSLVDDLLEFLRSNQCVAEQLSENTLYLEPPTLPIPEAALLELDLYLRVWEALHPGTIERAEPA